MKNIRNLLGLVLLFASLALVASVWSQTVTALLIVGMAINWFRLADAIVAHVRVLRRQPKHEPLTQLPEAHK